jgi:hypothetical protein
MGIRIRRWQQRVDGFQVDVGIGNGKVGDGLGSEGAGVDEGVGEGGVGGGVEEEGAVSIVVGVFGGTGRRDGECGC